MKKPILFSCGMFFAFINLFAQTPQSIPYQAVARDVNGTPIPNKHMSIRLTIHNASSGGSNIYAESDTFTSSSLGLFTVNLGTGSVLSGSFSGIDWKDSTKFLQVELDTTGGTSYTNMGTTQMLSVPYALYSGSSNNGIDVATAPIILSHDTISTSLAGWNLLSTISASSTASVQFTGLSSSYNLYALVITGLIPATAQVAFWVRVGTGSGPTWQSGSGSYEWVYHDAETDGTGTTTGTIVVGNASDTKMQVLSNGISNDASASTNVIMYIFNPSSSTGYPNINGTLSYRCSNCGMGSAATGGTEMFDGRYLSATAITGVEILVSSGNISSGKFKLYGIQ